MNIIELIDIKATPDIYHKYDTRLNSKNTPLVIDNGSYKCRAGWATSSSPLLEFRNLIAKPRKDRKKEAPETVPIPAIQIGNDVNINMQLKTQFDRNIVTHFCNQEQIFDYIFSHLSIDATGNIPHPILLTEAVANPNYCRLQMNELLFECYGVPGLAYGVDSLFSWRRNQQCEFGLILSFGYHTTHIIPIVDGRAQMEHVRRLNVGGYHIIMFFFRLMQMKYPMHLNAITIGRMETLIHNHGFVAYDYKKELENWAKVDYYTKHVKKIQLPYTIPIQTTTQNVEQKSEKRKEMARRLIEINLRRTKEKQLEDEEKLSLYCNARQMYEENDVESFQKALKELGFATLLELNKNISIVNGRLDRKKQKKQGNTDVQIIPLKGKEYTGVRPPTELPLETWISDIRNKRDVVLKRKNARKLYRQELGKRHTAAAQERMRIISSLARHEKGTDEFGMNDNDWDVYKVINRENGSDSEAENDQLIQYESILRQYDPNFEEPQLGCEGSAENYQLHIGVEFMRAPEVLFQPSMIGKSEAGLVELIDFVLKLFKPTDQQRMVNNIFLTGGCAKFRGLRERLQKELLEIRPFQTHFCIYSAELPDLEAWSGARDFACSDDFQNYLFTKEIYEEYGQGYFKTHAASNSYFPTPK